MELYTLAQMLHDAVFRIQHISSIELIIFTIIAIPTIYAMLGAPFVPTHMKQVKRMMHAAQLRKGMKIYDLGCGDGRLVHEASAIVGSTKAIGYEYSPLVYLWAKFISIFWRGGAIKYGNIWNQDFSDADVIFCYLLPHAMAKFEKIVLPQLKPGSLIVSHAFEMPTYPIYKKIPRDEMHAPVVVYKISTKIAPKQQTKKQKGKNQI